MLAGVFLAAAVLLVAAGLPKLRDPQPLVRALRSVGLTASRPLVRALAAAEVATGLAAVGTGHRLAAVAVALSYAAFTGFVGLALVRGGVLSSCGCFGRPDTPPTAVHAAVTAAYAAVAAGVAAAPVGRLDALLGDSPARGVPLIVVTAAVAFLSYVVLADLPRVLRRGVAAAAPRTTP